MALQLSNQRRVLGPRGDGTLYKHLYAHFQKTTTGHPNAYETHNACQIPQLFMETREFDMRTVKLVY